jgi:formylglycine-generating enzyme required for sulfatase activity
VRQPSFIPESLQSLGFIGQIFNGIEVIIPPLMTISAGPFLMGSDKAKDNQAHDNELPQHTINLTPYEIGKYPLIVAEYACFVRATKHEEPHSPFNNLTWKQQQERINHPVVNIVWKDALAYAQWLAKLTNEQWRLPTEAEWEKAARGVDGRKYPWGNEWDKTKANTSDGGPGTTTLVGTYPQGASPYGCLDMAGNVWEWTSTIFKPYPYQANDGREDLNTQGNRVLRGGAWLNYPQYARVACRFHYRIGYFDGNFGVRLARGRAG